MIKSKNKDVKVVDRGRRNEELSVPMLEWVYIVHPGHKKAAHDREEQSFKKKRWLEMCDTKVCVGSY